MDAGKNSSSKQRLRAGPEARAWKGHHASALTAAQCAVRRWAGREVSASQMCSTLSLPPLASCAPLGDHLSPHTSCSCPRSVAVTCSRTLRARHQAFSALAEKVSNVQATDCVDFVPSK